MGQSVKEIIMYPTVKTLSRIFGDNAATARAILEGKKDPEDFPETAAWVRRCFHRPSRSALKMSALNELGDFYGVEAVFGSVGRLAFEYLNAGDTYTLTLVRYASGTYRVTCWGDVVESMERRGIRFT
jgi:hypothetical protein